MREKSMALSNVRRGEGRVRGLVRPIRPMDPIGLIRFRKQRRFGMFQGRSSTLLAVLLAVTLLGFFTGCAKKSIAPEEGMTTEGTGPAGPSMGMGPGTGRPSEQTLSAEERERREAEAAFTNQDVPFEYDKYDLSPRGREILADKAYFLKKYPGSKVLIEGHCDERGTSEYNLALGERRANSAKQYLVHLGIAEGRISTISYGKERPLDPGHNEAAWSRNRRAHFVIASR
jgi:peptidoglycan-associated lipoprotein